PSGGLPARGRGRHGAAAPARGAGGGGGGGAAPPPPPPPVRGATNALAATKPAAAKHAVHEHRRRA
ncbi:hypothetical protein, partial [Xanthomonas euvesicatoria]|uniref:hypothetical protein n=1 Tax=Xanthomonas euvesicatoria TaxID=456327 RepID=UPI00235811F0